MEKEETKNLKSKYFFIDTHAHIDMIDEKTLQEIINDACASDVRYIINTGSDMEGSKKSAWLAREYENIFATVGVHPHHADTFSSKEVLILESLIKNNKK